MTSMAGYREISEVNSYLFICGVHAIKLDALKQRGITLVVNATLEIPNHFVKDFEYLPVPIDDSPFADIAVHFDRVADKIYEVRQKGGKVLVHCIAGASRSASLCIAYLMKYKRLSLRDAFYFLKSRRSVVHPNSGFFQQLINYERKLFGKVSVKMMELPNMGPGPMVPDIYAEHYKGLVWLSKIRHSVKKT